MVATSDRLHRITVAPKDRITRASRLRLLANRSPTASTRSTLTASPRYWSSARSSTPPGADRPDRPRGRAVGGDRRLNDLDAERARHAGAARSDGPGSRPPRAAGPPAPTAARTAPGDAAPPRPARALARPCRRPARDHQRPAGLVASERWATSRRSRRKRWVGPSAAASPLSLADGRGVGDLLDDAGELRVALPLGRVVESRCGARSAGRAAGRAPSAPATSSRSTARRGRRSSRCRRCAGRRRAESSRASCACARRAVCGPWRPAPARPSRTG